MSMLRWIAGLAMVCCVAAVATAGEEASIKITDLPKGATQGVLDVGQKSRNAAFTIATVSDNLKGLPVVTVPRGDMAKPGAAFKVTIDKPATAYLIVMNRGKVSAPEGWTKTDEKLTWKSGNAAPYSDTIYSKKVEAGEVAVPEHDGKEGNAYGIPNSIAFKVE